MSKENSGYRPDPHQDSAENDERPNRTWGCIAPEAVNDVLPYEFSLTELPIGDLDEEELKKKVSRLRLLRRKLLETRDRYIESNIALREEIEADVIPLAEVIWHLTPFTAGTAITGAMLVGIFGAKRFEVKNEFLQTLKIWNQYRTNIIEAIDSNTFSTQKYKEILDELDKSMRESGVLFEGISDEIDSKDFKREEFRAWLQKFGLREKGGESWSKILTKENGHSLKERFQNYLSHTWESCKFNYSVEGFKQTGKNAWAGLKGVFKTVAEIEFLKNRHREDYIQHAHEELAAERPDAEKIPYSSVTQDFIDREILAGRKDLRSHIGMTKLRALTVTTACGFWIFNAGSLIEKGLSFGFNAASGSFDAESLAWIIGNIWALNRSMGPIRDISQTLVRHDFPVIDSKRAHYIEAHNRVRETIIAEQSARGAEPS